MAGRDTNECCHVPTRVPAGHLLQRALRVDEEMSRSHTEPSSASEILQNTREASVNEMVGHGSPCPKPHPAPLARVVRLTDSRGGVLPTTLNCVTLTPSDNLPPPHPPPQSPLKLEARTREQMSTQSLTPFQCRWPRTSTHLCICDCVALVQHQVR